MLPLWEPTEGLPWDVPGAALSHDDLGQLWVSGARSRWRWGEGSGSGHIFKADATGFATFHSRGQDHVPCPQLNHWA